MSVVAVIIYSPQVSGGDNTASSTSTEMLTRVQQLEWRVEQLQVSLESLEAQVQQQSDYDGTVSSQILNVQNSVQNLSLVQNNTRQDLDRLRTINLYEGCIQDTRNCTITSASNNTYATCNTGYVIISPRVSLSP